MMKIEKYSTPDFEEGLYINLENGEVFATVSSLARLLGKKRQTIQKFLSFEGFDSCNQSEEKTAGPIALKGFDSCNQSEEKTAETKPSDLRQSLKSVEIETDAGKRIAKLIPEPIILEAISKYKPDLIKACASAGLRVFLHRLAGFEVTTTAIAPAKSDKELLLEAQLESRDLKIQLIETQKLVVEKENYILKATNSRPGLEKMLEDFQDLNPIGNFLPADSPKVSLREWMVNNKQIVLEGKLYRKFVSKVHGAFKAINNKNPDKESKQKADTKFKTKVQVYELKDYPILDQCYKQTILEN